MSIGLTGSHLTLDELRRVAFNKELVELTPEATKKVRASRQVVEDILASGKVVYGVNTGFGNFRDVVIPRQDLDRLQMNLLRSHACGVGAPLPEPLVRAVMLLRANTLAAGYSGVHPETLDHLLELLNKGVHPVVPEQGSVGASGDLAPLAHLALVLIGEGEAFVKGQRMSGQDALKAVSIPAIKLHPKDGLALINGTQVASALLANALLEANRLIHSADVIGALTLDTLLGSYVAFDPRIHEARPHPGQAASARNLRKLLEGSELRESHSECGRVQDSYSLRCMPQVHGTVRDALDYAERVLSIEMNSATDNPMVFAPSGDVLSGGNFHGQPIAQASDFTTIALSELGAISERRTERLVNPQLSGLPPFLVKEGGLNSGFMMVQVTAAALASENKSLSHPASVDSIPTSANQEDHVSMAVTAARKASVVARNVARILSIELLCATQALDLRRPLSSSKALEAVYRLVRDRVRHFDEDRAHYPDIESVDYLLWEGQVLSTAASEVGGLD
jgi:histidine ammonia-lyase